MGAPPAPWLERLGEELDGRAAEVTTNPGTDQHYSPTYQKVELRWRTVGAFTRVTMLDDGLSGENGVSVDEAVKMTSLEF